MKPDQTCQVALGTGSGILFTFTELGPPTKFARQGATAAVMLQSGKPVSVLAIGFSSIWAMPVPPPVVVGTSVNAPE